MLLSTGPRHELPPDAAPQASTDVFTSRLRDRLDALAVILGQQAEVSAAAPRAQAALYSVRGHVCVIALGLVQPF